MEAVKLPPLNPQKFRDGIGIIKHLQRTVESLLGLTMIALGTVGSFPVVAVSTRSHFYRL